MNMATKKWTEYKTFRFRFDILRIGLGGNYFLWAKIFQGNK